MRSALLFVAFGVAAFARAQEPVFLIHQKVPLDGGGNPVVSDLAIEVAEEFRTVFKLNPVVWSMLDSQFRDAVYNQQAPEGVFDPTIPQLESVARNLKAPYFATIQIKTDRELLGTIIAVYRTGQKRPVWTKTLETESQVGGVNSRLQAEKALARSWGFELRQGVFKSLIREVAAPIPEPVDGTPITPDPTPLPVAPDDQNISDVEMRVADLLKNRLPSEALTVLYEAVDQRPQHLALRKLLIDTLVKYGPSADAVEECRRAIMLWPGEDSFRLARIRGLLALNRSDEAASELNEALVRDPDSLDVIELKGHVALVRGLLQQAREAYLLVLSKEPRPGVQASLALTVALEGDTAEARRLMNTLPPTDPATTAEIYHRLAMGTQQAIERMANEMRELLRLGRLQSGNQNAPPRAQRVFKACEGLSGVWVSARVPENHRASHDRRVLAQKLLTQAAAEILQFVRSSNPDSGDEATLSLGEALRQTAEAHRDYNAER